MKRTIIISMLITLSISAFCQYEQVIFNYERSLFNDGQSLPAESYFTLTGGISKKVTQVAVNFYNKNGNNKSTPLYSKTWKREYNNTKESFELPINYKLRSNNNYDIEIIYYRLASGNEIENLKSELILSIDSYIEQNLATERKGIKLAKSAGGMVSDLNSIVTSSLTYYKSQSGAIFDGFSDLVLDKINLISKTKMNKKSEDENAKVKAKHIKELKVRVHSELSHVLNSGLSIIGDVKYIDNYAVEKVKTIFTFHGGYGGVPLSGDIAQANFGSAPMVGITLPLGKKAFSSSFWSRSAIMTGIFLQDFKGDDGISITGPIISKPIYAGLGYKVFQFIRLTGGIVILENNVQSSNGNDINTNVYVKPYLGLTIDINIWMDLGK